MGFDDLVALFLLERLKKKKLRVRNGSSRATTLFKKTSILEEKERRV